MSVWKNLSTPDDPDRRHPGRAGAHRRSPGDRHIAPRHHGRHQRRSWSARARWSPTSPPGLPRRAVHPARQPQATTTSAGSSPSRWSSAATASSSTSASTRYGDVVTPLDEAGRARRWRGNPKPRARSRRSPSACCSPSSTPPRAARRRRSCAEELPDVPVSHLLRRAAEVEGVRAGLDHDRRRLSQAGSASRLTRMRERLRRRRLRRPRRGHQVERRRDDPRGRRRRRRSTWWSPARPAASSARGTWRAA